MFIAGVEHADICLVALNSTNSRSWWECHCLFNSPQITWNTWHGLQLQWHRIKYFFYTLIQEHTCLPLHPKKLPLLDSSVKWLWVDLGWTQYTYRNCLELSTSWCFDKWSNSEPAWHVVPRCANYDRKWKQNDSSSCIYYLLRLPKIR